MYVYVYIYIKGNDTVRSPHRVQISRSEFCRVDYLIEVRQTVLCRATRADRISIEQCRAPPPRRRGGGAQGGLRRQARAARGGAPSS